MQTNATTTTYADSGLTASTTYSYRILARDQAGNESAQSAAVSATTMPPPVIPDTTPPTVPQNLAATAAGSDRIALSWSAATDTGGSNLRAYKLYRGGVFLREVVAPALTHTDMGLSAATNYSYSISAVDNANNESARSAMVSATTSALNGATLYATNCAGCHNPLATTTRRGRTAAQISAAIVSVPTMTSLSSLTSAQIAAIAAALVVPEPTGNTFDHFLVVGDRHYVESELKSIFVATAGATAEDTTITNIIDAQVRDKISAFGGPCNRYDDVCPGGAAAHDVNISAAAFPQVDPIRKGYMITGCEEILAVNKAVTNALSRANVAVTTNATTTNVAALYSAFFPGRPAIAEIFSELVALFADAKVRGYSNLDAWRYTLVPLCSAPDMDLL